MESELLGTRRTQLYAWLVFALVAAVATWLFGPLALIVLAFVAGTALIVTGARSTGWTRPVLIAAGSLLVALPILFVADLWLGGWEITVR